MSLKRMWPHDLEMKPVAMITNYFSVKETLASLGFMQDDQLNACIVTGFGADVGLRDWCQHVCSLGAVVKTQLCYWEGHESKPGETFHDHLFRKLCADFADAYNNVVEDGVQQQTASILMDSGRVQELHKCILQAMELHDIVLGNDGHEQCECSSGLLWMIKIGINEENACVKFHDDFVKLRLVFTMEGDGTVVAPGPATDWGFWQSSGGLMKPQKANFRKRLKLWNHRVCPEEIETKTGDLLMMKGGRSTTRPCVHRAPYSAEVWKKSNSGNVCRFLVTIERVSPEDRDKSIELFHAESTDEEESTEISTSVQKLETLLPTTVLSGKIGDPIR